LDVSDEEEMLKRLTPDRRRGSFVRPQPEKSKEIKIKFKDKICKSLFAILTSLTKKCLKGGIRQKVFL
jgi:hypothetical protein